MATPRLQKFKEKIGVNKAEIEKKFRVKEIGIFGSYVRGEQNKNSDGDILVDFHEPIGLFRFMDLEEYLENLLKTNVDLVSQKALKPNIGGYIMLEVQPIW